MSARQDKKKSLPVMHLVTGVFADINILVDFRCSLKNLD